MDNKKGIHPLYLTTVNINKICKSNKLDKYIFDKCFKENSKDNWNVFKPGIYLDKGEILSNFYKIESWEDTNKYVKKNKNNIKINTIKRLISYSWRCFKDKIKINYDNIIEIYVIYCKLSKINKDVKQITKIIMDSVKTFEKDKNTKLIHKKIYKMLKN